MEVIVGFVLRKYFETLFHDFDCRNDLNIQLLQGKATVTNLGKKSVR
jgi:hypothetical protein